MILANVLQPLVDVFNAVIKFIHDTFGVSWGLSIILLTVFVRLLLVPLAVKTYKSMQGLQRIAPELKKLQEKYKDDKQRLNQEMMKLYSEHKVNPFASCLPLLAQLPVFISLFYLLQDDLRVEICGQSAKPCGESPESSFLFIPDITDEATGIVLIALVVLYVASQLASSLLMSVSADKNQRRIFLALPFVFVPFILNFPAGLLVYWITTNLWTIVQQFIVRRTVGPVVKPGELPAAKDDEEDKGGGLRKALGGSPKPAAVASSGGGSNSPSGSAPRRTSAPPPPPSKRKKKRSGRRR